MKIGLFCIPNGTSSDIAGGVIIQDIEENVICSIRSDSYGRSELHRWCHVPSEKLSFDTEPGLVDKGYIICKLDGVDEV